MQLETKLTLDGLLAFAGGALALLGVWWSNHQSVRNLQKQLDAEKQARRQEEERQKRTVAGDEIDFVRPIPDLPRERDYSRRLGG